MRRIPKFFRYVGPFVPWILFVFLVVLRVSNPPILIELRNKVFDVFQRLHPREQVEDVGVRIVDLDEETLRRTGQWPWPRTRVAELIARIHEQGAAAIALDIVFAESDRTSPAALSALWSNSADLKDVRDKLSAMPDHDAILAEAIRPARVVTGFSFSSEPTPSSPIVKASFAYAGEDPRPYVLAYPGVVSNLPILENASAGNGHFTLAGESEYDGVVRRVPLLLMKDEQLYPSLVAEGLRVAQGASTYVVKTTGASGQRDFGARTGVTQVKVGRLVIPTDSVGRVWVHFRPAREITQIPAWKVLEKEIPANTFDGALVFVGTSASGLRDLRTTPLEPMVAGITVHAQLAEQILSGVFLQRPDWADGAEIVFVAALGMLLLVLLPRMGAVPCAAIAAAALAAAVGGSWLAFIRRGWLLDPVMPVIAVLGLYIAGSLVNFLKTEQERSYIREAFGRYLSPALVEELAKHPESLKLGGQLRPMSVLFADIRDFTTLSETLDAEALTRFMNRFLTPMTQVVLDHSGTIDKYIGDCLMAFWNAPLEDSDYVRHACEAAIGMRRALHTWNRRPHEPKVNLGIGIGTGECCVGNIGSEQRFDYSVLGDTVNLASRLEGHCKTFGADIIVDEETAKAAEGLAFLELDNILVKGKTRPIRIFALIGDRALAASPGFRELVQAQGKFLAAYRGRDWEKALACLAVCREKIAGLTLEKAFGAYEARIRAFQMEPPAADWNGVWVASSK